MLKNIGSDSLRMGVRLYNFKNGKMNLISNYEKTYDIISMGKPIRKWYKRNPYAKRISKHWICRDYRIDQQRPQRNVYSEAYIKIVNITDIEEMYLTELINEIEKDIIYPTVWDNGEERFYEETIYCPKCGKRRKVLTSETHCEYCGFEFNKAKKCPKCNGLNLRGSDECRICGYKFRKKSFINNEEFVVEKNEKSEKIRCPICNEKKSNFFNVCKNCGFDFTHKKQCVNCGKWVNDEDKFCMYCGQKLNVYIICDNCSSKNKLGNNYCNNCGEKL